MAEDPSYCSWVMDLSAEDALISTLSGFQRFLVDRRFQAPADNFMTVGKHTGKTFDEVMTEDPIYCSWILDPSSGSINSPVMLRFKKFLQDKGFQAVAEDVMIIGKHKGKTFEEVMREDPAFCTWVLDPSSDIASSVVLTRLKKFLQDHSFQALADDVMIVGKYTGKTFEEMMIHDPTYCKSVMRLVAEQGTNNTVMLRLKKFLETQGFHLHPSEDVFTLFHIFGREKNGMIIFLL